MKELDKEIANFLIKMQTNSAKKTKRLLLRLLQLRQLANKKWIHDVCL